MWRIMAFVGVLVVGPAWGQVYKCKEGATTVFSAMPCAVGARPIEVKPASGASRPPAVAKDSDPVAAAPPPDAGKGMSAPRTLSQRADEAARRRILDDDIWRKQREIDALTEEHRVRQDQLSRKKTRANNNLAGAVWEQSISDEMQAVAAEYDMRLRKANQELNEIKARRAKIPD